MQLRPALLLDVSIDGVLCHQENGLHDEQAHTMICEGSLLDPKAPHTLNGQEFPNHYCRRCRALCGEQAHAMTCQASSLHEGVRHQDTALFEERAHKMIWKVSRLDQDVLFVHAL